MVILCPNCSARFRIDTSGIKLERFKIKCPKCADAIVVENPPEIDLPVSLESEGPSAGVSARNEKPEPSPEPSTDLVGGPDESITSDLEPEVPMEEARTEDLPVRGSGRGAPLDFDPPMDDPNQPTPENVRIARRTAPTPPEGVPEERAKEPRDSIESVRTELNSGFEAMQKHNYFELLGITKDSTPDEVKGAYFRLAKKYHPDRYVAHFSDEEMRRLRDVSSRLNLAFNELRDPDRHKQYVLKITQPERYEKQQSANRVMEAMMQYEKGKVLFNKQNFPEALKCFEWAVELHSTEAEYHFMVGQTCLRGSEGMKPDFDRILAALEKAAEIQPGTAKYHMALGSYWKRRGEIKRAMRYFKSAKGIDPKNHEADREIRLYLDRKRKAEDEQSASGKLKKLFAGNKKTDKVQPRGR